MWIGGSLATSPAFEWLCNELEEGTDLDRLEARGTVRIVLREAGLEARAVTAKLLRVVIDKLLPEELTVRGVDAADEFCCRMLESLQLVQLDGGDANTPDAMFDRLEGL